MRYLGEETAGLGAPDGSRGVVQVPQGRGIADMSVTTTSSLGWHALNPGEIRRYGRRLRLVSGAAERHQAAGSLSGGEQTQL